MTTIRVTQDREAAQRARTTTFIVKGLDFFVANLDTGGVRVGMVGGDSYDLGPGTTIYANAMDCHNESAAEDVFDACVEAYGL